MHCDRKKAYKTPQEAGRVASLRQADGAPTLYPYECPECGCFHLSKMDRAKASNIAKPVPVQPLPAPVPPTKDKRLSEARQIILAQRANFIRQDGDEWWYLVTLGDGSVVMAMTNGGTHPRVKCLEEPDEMARTMYPRLVGL